MADQVARLKVTLKGIRPPIWRRLEVPTGFTFQQLNDVIQAAFGWTNSHLHEFRIGRRRIGMPSDDDSPISQVSALIRSIRADLPPDILEAISEPLPLEDEKTVTLAEAFGGAQTRLEYVYDFGDDWRHDVLVERLSDPEPGVVYPRCLTGRRSGPPEDCGGAWGYQAMLEVLADPAHERYDELRKWAPYFEPEEFDLSATDEAVRNPPEFWE
jgi:hypothetical protein